MRIQDGPWKICEGIAGMWFYHLCPKESNALEALCGRQTMPTQIRLEYWGQRVEHIPERYCLKCQQIALKRMKEKT